MFAVPITKSKLNLLTMESTTTLYSKLHSLGEPAQKAFQCYKHYRRMRERLDRLQDRWKKEGALYRKKRIGYFLETLEDTAMPAMREKLKRECSKLGLTIR